MNIKQSQNGFLHLGSLVILTLAIIVITFTGVRVLSSNKSNTKSIGNTTNTIKSVSKTSVTTAQQKTADIVPVATKVPVTSVSTTGTTLISPKSSIYFTKGGQDVDTANVNVSVSTSAVSLIGTCTFNFTLNSYKVTRSNAASGTTCNISVPLSAYLANGDWYYTINFVSSDGNKTGEGGGTTVSIQPRVIQFTKGGNNTTASDFQASNYMSESQTGTCSSSFSQGGVVKLSASTQITNSNLCSVSVSLSQFPASGIYSFSTVFNSSDARVTASGTYDVTITK